MKSCFFFVLLSFSFLISNGQDQNISNGNIFDGEPYIAINPTNSQHLVIAWMSFVPFSRIVIKTKVSFNGGQTWLSGENLPHLTIGYTSADVSLAFDNNGDVFISYIDFTGFDVNPFAGGVYVSKSNDGGLTWNIPVEVISIDSDPGKMPIDRPWISIDRSSGSGQGNIFITTMNAKNAISGFNPYFIRSIDGGNSFEQWRYLDTTGWLAGFFIPQPMPTSTVSSDGIFYAVYPSLVFAQNPLAQFIVASTENAGNSFNYQSVFSATTNVTDSLAKKGYLLRADPSLPGHIAFFYLDVPFGDIDVFMRESFDGGNSWSVAIRVNDDPIANNRMQDLLWADFDTDGDLVVSWRDRRNAPDSTYETASAIWGTFRSHDGPAFSQNFRISDFLVPYDSILGFSGNDFMCIQLINDTLNAVWGDARTGKLNIWYKRKSIADLVVSVDELSPEQPLINVFPNPFNSKINIKGNKIEWVTVFDQNGKSLLSKVNSSNNTILDFDLSHLSPGVYFLKIKTKKGIVKKLIVKENSGFK